MKLQKTGKIIAEGLLVLILVCFLLSGRYACAKEYYLIPGEADFFEVFSLEDTEFKLTATIPVDGINYLAWPNYDRVNNRLYFEGRAPTSHSKIYRYTASDKNKLSTVVEGRLPALSPDGSLLSYYRHPSHLWIMNLQTGNSTEVADDIDGYKPPVWVANTRLLYNNTSISLILLDVSNRKKVFTGHEMVTPGALSPDGKTVICSGNRSIKIFIYFLETNRLQLVQENTFLSINSKFIWRPDGKSFLYIRQTWANTLRFRETGGLFLYSLEDGKDTQLLGSFHFFGGLEGDFSKLLQP